MMKSGARRVLDLASRLQHISLTFFSMLDCTRCDTFLYSPGATNALCGRDKIIQIEAPEQLQNACEIRDNAAVENHVSVAYLLLTQPGVDHIRSERDFSHQGQTSRAPIEYEPFSALWNRGLVDICQDEMKKLELVVFIGLGHCSATTLSSLASSCNQ